MNVRQALSMVGAFGLLAGSSLAATTLPYAEGFEDGVPLDPANWSSSGTIAASSDTLTGAGTKALSIVNATVTLGVDALQDNKNVWIQVYAKPVRGSASSPPAIGDASGAFFVSNEGQLVARDHSHQDGWRTLGAEGEFPVGQYYGFIVHAKFNGSGGGTYDIYKTTGDYKSPMVLMNDSPMTFNNAATSTKLTAVKIQSGEAAVVDAVAVSKANIDPGTTVDTVAVYEHHNSGIVDEFQLPAFSERYAVNDAARQLDGALGFDILSGLVGGDILKVWNGTTHEGHTVGAGPAFSSPGVEIGLMTSMMIQYGDDQRVDTFGFYPYVAADVMAVDGVVNESSTVDFPETVVLNGNQTQGGWTPLNPTLPADTALDSPAFPFNDTDVFDNGDFLFISLDDTPNSWTVYEWEEDFGIPHFWKKRIGTILVNPVPTGANMWVKRLTDENNVSVVIGH